MNIGEVTPRLIKAARELLGWNQDVLARKSRLSLSTIRRYETKGLARASVSNIEAIVRAFEDDGVSFLQDGDRVGLSVQKAMVG